MLPTPLYARIASALEAQENCDKTGNDWPHMETVANLVREYMPSGSGFDSGTELDSDSKPNRLVFTTSFHHTNDGGMYDGWTEHSVIITPNLAHGFELRVTGRDRNDIKDYIALTFGEVLHRVLTDDECGHLYARPDRKESAA